LKVNCQDCEHKSLLQGIPTVKKKEWVVNAEYLLHCFRRKSVDHLYNGGRWRQ
jgi:hypothetical protein